MIRTPVVLADDHAVLRDGLQTLINRQPDLQVVGTAGTGPQAIERVRETGARVVCLDLSMPGWGGAKTIERMRSECPQVKVLVLTMHEDPAYVRAAVAAGAHGYLLKSSPAAELLAAIRSVAAGEQAFPVLSGDKPGVPGSHKQDQLSRREREVLELLICGYTHQVIADRLFLSVKSVETYRARIRAKMGLKTRADFVRYGLDTGLLDGTE